MNDTGINNNDEAEDPGSHLQEVVNDVVDDVDLDSATEEDALTLDPSTSSSTPTFTSLSLSLLYRYPLTRVTISPRPISLRPPRNLLLSLLVRLDPQTLLRCRRPPQPQPKPILAIGRSATALAHHTLFQVGQGCQDKGVLGFPPG